MKVTVTEKSYSEYTEEDIAATLRATSASIGGGSEVLVIEEVNDGMDIRREDGSDLHPSRGSEHSRCERLQTTTGGDL